MSTRTMWFLPLLFLLPACQSATLESAQRPGYSFADLRTYFFLSDEAAGVEGMTKEDRRFSKGLAGLVRDEFKKYGYEQDDRDPDFLVFVGAMTRSAVRRGGWHRRGRASGQTRGSDFGRYEEGTIAIMAYDAKTGDEIFYVWARDAIRESEPPTEEGVVQIVKEMIARWPVAVPGTGAAE